jgi:hypothetical protein
MGAGVSAETNRAAAWRWKRTKRLPKYADVEDDYIRPAGHVVLGQVMSSTVIHSTCGNLAAALFAAQRPLRALRLLAVRCCAGRMGERAVCKDDRETANNSRAWQRYLYGDRRASVLSRACALLLRMACFLSPAATHDKSAFFVSLAHSLSQTLNPCCPRFIC